MTAPVTTDVPTSTFDEIIAAWNTAKPGYLLAFHHMAGKGVGWQSNFTLTYEITRDGWRYVVQAHVHIRHDGSAFAGNSFVPGYGNLQVQTPDWVVAAAPKYSSAVHTHGWTSDTTYSAKLYNGSYRYPTKL